MSWHFSRALVAEYSAATCSDGDAFAPSNTTPTPEAFYWPDKTTEHSRLSRFGMTSEPLTVSHGEELLTSYLVASRAKTSVLVEEATDSTESAAVSGLKWRASFARFDRSTSTWRTPQSSLLGDSDEFSETWPKWGSMQNGECSERTMPALRTSATESGFWPTPQAHDATKGYAKRVGRYGTKHGGRNLNDWVVSRSGVEFGHLNPMWVEWLMGWPLGWTDLKPLETVRFQEWQRLHGKH